MCSYAVHVKIIKLCTPDKLQCHTCHTHLYTYYISMCESSLTTREKHLLEGKLQGTLQGEAPACIVYLDYPLKP